MILIWRKNLWRSTDTSVIEYFPDKDNPNVFVRRYIGRKKFFGILGCETFIEVIPELDPVHVLVGHGLVIDLA
jgi:hypothetical protein